jgi:hypothetical protein
MTLFYFAEDRCSLEQQEQIRRGVGLAIGKIQMEILEVINAAHPNLDDLGELENEKPASEDEAVS